MGNRNILNEMRNRNNPRRETIWTEHFTIRSYLKDFSEFSQGGVHYLGDVATARTFLREEQPGCIPRKVIKKLI